jgi:hypothetical protein
LDPSAFYKQNWVADKYVAALHNLGLEQVIKEMTRHTIHKNSLIDHIICSPLRHYTAGVLDIELADHFGTYMIVHNASGGPPDKQEQHCKAIMSHKPERLEALRESISMINWPLWWTQQDGKSVDEIVELFNNLLDYHIKESCEIKLKNNKCMEKNPWMTKCLLWEQGTLNKLRNKFMKNKNTVNDYNYKSAKRVYNQKIKQT